ncbi:glycoside hydrolase family 7 protein [Tulasnella calospora MUT 4182]|uniref:Glucanase n=1 Tax=Tulasnella calospora MUT 4182 TaxID=1051891 RepID=A0A0C3KYK9_9AGAM|nr:glycoside hydrolase family 7 protein [Tulasnella calospora MUT 4182]
MPITGEMQRPSINIIDTPGHVDPVEHLPLPNSNGKNVGSRLYLMSDDSIYNIFKVMNQGFSFDVDVSQLPCGLNGALYFSEMEADGGMSKYSTNKAGAKYGTGYGDSQCPRGLKFIAGRLG